MDAYSKMRLVRTMYRKCFYLIFGGLLVSLTILFVVANRKNGINLAARQGLGREPLGYVLTLSYTGQQVAGIRGLISQQCWMKAFDLPMAIVSPFLQNSHLMHSKELWVNFTDHAKQQQRIGTHLEAPTFDRYFDIQHFNNMSRMAGNPQLVAWTNFLETGPKSLIVLDIENVFAKRCLTYKKEQMCDKNRNELNSQTRQQFTTGCKPSNDTSTAIEYLKSVRFQVVRRVCLNCEFGMEQSVTPNQIVDYVFGNHKPSEVTLVINQWKFSIMMSPTCSNMQTCHAKAFDTEIVPSKSILADVETYLNRLSLRISAHPPPKLTVAIMIRIEWLLISRKGASLDIVKDCLNSISKQYRSLILHSKHKQAEILPLLALDIGKFGSTSFDSTMRIHKIRTEYLDDLISLVKDFVSITYKGKLNFEQWEETYEELLSKGVAVDGGYIATVQSTIASSADCMILAGGGHFQIMAEERYNQRKYGNTPCLYKMCT